MRKCLLPVTINGETKTMHDWYLDHRCQCSKALLRHRFESGYPEEELLLPARHPSLSRKNRGKYKVKRKDVHVFKHLDNGTYAIATIKEMTMLFDLNPKNLYALVSGYSGYTKGWMHMGAVDELYPDGIPTNYKSL